MIKEYLYLMRKKRSDRNHLIYKITCLPTLDEYIGVTVMNSTSVKKAMKTRWKQHCYKAQVVSPDWSLSESIREHGEDMFLIEPLEYPVSKNSNLKTFIMGNFNFPVAAFISGAGPTVLALLVDADLNHELEDLVRAAGAGFEVENLDISGVGYQVSNI